MRVQRPVKIFLPRSFLISTAAYQIVAIYQPHAELLADVNLMLASREFFQPDRVATIPNSIGATMSRRMQSFQVPPSG